MNLLPKLLEETADMVTERSAEHAQACRHAATALTGTVGEALNEFMRLYEDGKLGTDSEVIEAYNAAVLALPSAVEQSDDIVVSLPK